MKDKKTNKFKNNVLHLLEKKTDDYQNKIALGIKGLFGWNEFTFKGIGLMSRKIANYLINNLDIQKGEHVAILSESKPEFGACLFASVMSGTTFVPIDIKLTIYELTSILSDCKPSVLFVSQAHLDTAKELQSNLDFIKHIILIDDVPTEGNHISVYKMDNNFEGKYRRSSLRSTVFLIYTSGTTGSAKGVEISYLNMLTQLKAIEGVRSEFFPDYEKKQPSVLSILPMNHLFELTVGFCAFMHWGLSIYYTQSLRPNDILDIMREKNVNFMIVVPAFLKLLKSGIETQIKASSPVARSLFKFMYNLAKYIPSMKIRKVLFSKIHKKFGGNFNGCISGGAPLDTEVGEFFERIGIKVFHGYGLSETSPVVCVNYDKRQNMHSVGRPFDCFETKIDPKTGEILFRGPSVMKGYYKRPDLTSEAIDSDGWLHTGDIGKLDKHGHLYITGRIKNMIVLSGGKKVFPEDVETVLEKSPLFKEICVFGTPKKSGQKENDEEIAVIVVPSDEIASKENCKEIITAEVKQLSKQLASYKRPIRIIVTNEALPRTTTRKVKRLQVKELVNSIS